MYLSKLIIGSFELISFFLLFISIEVTTILDNSFLLIIAIISHNIKYFGYSFFKDSKIFPNILFLVNFPSISLDMNDVSY